MKDFIIRLFITVQFFVPTLAKAETDWNQWFNERTNVYESLRNKPDEEKIPVLGQMLRINDDPVRNPLDGLRLKSYLRAQVDLLAIIGHSRYYDTRIRQKYEAYKGTVMGYRDDGDMGEFLREMNWGFNTMSQLPSPETVKVMGEMLSEVWAAPQPENPKITMPPSLAICVVLPLSKLPLIDPPTRRFDAYPAAEDLLAWQKWYAEMKAGERSFAFIGQPVSHRFKPDGSVETQPRDASNDPPLFPPAEKEEQKAIQQPTEKIEESSRLPWIIGGLAALALAMAGFFLRKKAKAR